MPTSKETLVRVELFSKIMARHWPAKALLNLAGDFLILAAKSNKPRISLEEYSSNVNKCRGEVDMGGP
jgi:hypothetical protein